MNIDRFRSSSQNFKGKIVEDIPIYPGGKQRRAGRNLEP